MSARDALHALVDDLTDQDLNTAQRALESIRRSRAEAKRAPRHEAIGRIAARRHESQSFPPEQLDAWIKASRP